MPSPLASDLRLALDPVAFAESVGIEPDAWQAKTLRSPAKQTILNCSRQAGKSTVASVLGLHRALYRPNSLVLLVSPSLRQSSELFRKVTDLVAKMEIAPKLTEDNKLSLALDNGSRIVSLPGNEATIRGFSAVNLVIEDEASRVPDDLYRAVRPMLAISGGSLFLMSTPFGKRGHFFEEWENGGPSWSRVSVTAEQCPRISKEFLEAERASMGAWWFEQEFGCSFKDAVGAVFTHDVISDAFSDDVPPLFDDAGTGPVNDDDELPTLFQSEAVA